MDLKTYFARKNAIPHAELAKLVGVSKESIRLWANNDRKPKPAHVAKIVEATGGKVTRSGLRPDIYPPRKRAA